ncbi:hypothetical protein ACFFRR_004168 [Megaselia abdita]
MMHDNYGFILSVIVPRWILRLYTSSFRATRCSYSLSRHPSFFCGFWGPMTLWATSFSPLEHKSQMSSMVVCRGNTESLAVISVEKRLQILGFFRDSVFLVAFPTRFYKLKLSSSTSFLGVQHKTLYKTVTTYCKPDSELLLRRITAIIQLTFMFCSILNFSISCPSNLLQSSNISFVAIQNSTQVSYSSGSI